MQVVFLEREIAGITPCRTELLITCITFIVCSWLRLLILVIGAHYARDKKRDILARIAGGTGSTVRGWWQGPGRKPLLLLGDLGSGRNGHFIVLYTWL